MSGRLIRSEYYSINVRERDPFSMSAAALRNCCFMPSQSWLTTSQLTTGACPSAYATVKPFATRPVLLSYTNAAPTVIKTPRILPNKICIAAVSHRFDGLNSQALIEFRWSQKLTGWRT